MAQSQGFDGRSFRKRMNKVGTAYRNRAMELISICRLFSVSLAAEQIFTKDTELSGVLQACDDALAFAAEAGERICKISDYRIETAFGKLINYERRFHSSRLIVRKRMERAMKEDTKGGSGISTHIRQFFQPQRTRVVTFHLMKSIINTNPIRLQQALTSYSNEEILWNFSRYPHSSGNQITLADNPHFYDRDPLITSPSKYQGGFTADPVDYISGVNDIYVLTNRPIRVYLEFGENSRAFDNVWRTNKIFIFKSICGRLDDEHVVGAPIHGKSYRWCRAKPLPSQRQVGSTKDSPNLPSTSTMRTSTTDTSAWVPVLDWRETISRVLNSPDIRIRIKIITGPIPG